MLSTTAGILLVAAIMVNLVAFTQILRLSVVASSVLAAGVGIWVASSVIVSLAGGFVISVAQRVPLIGVYFAAPLIVAALAWLALPRLRRALLDVSAPVLISLHALRMFGVYFLLLEQAGQLAGPFPQFAGWGDILTGAAAVPLAIAVARGVAVPRAALVGWNVFGTLDLFTAVGLGVLSAEGSPLHLIHAGVGSMAMQGLPFSLIPTVLVPFYLITHGIIAAQIAQRRIAMRASPLATPAQT